MGINSPPIDLMRLSKNIKFERQRKGLSQRELAKELGFKGTGTITFWENGQFFPPLETFIKLCSYFGRSPNQMLCEDLTEAPPPLNFNDDTEGVGEGNPLKAVRAEKEEADLSPPLPQNKGDNKEDIKLLRQTALEILNKIEQMNA